MTDMHREAVVKREDAIRAWGIFYALREKDILEGTKSDRVDHMHAVLVDFALRYRDEQEKGDGTR